MFKTLRPLADTYITNRVVNGAAQLNANVGVAATLDLFKLYGYTSTLVGSSSVPNTELSRLLIQFDLSPLQSLVTQGLLDASAPSFSCHLHLFDVYGGQPTPTNFNVVVYPLSASFDEGIGRDVVYYSDTYPCNYLTSSMASGSWQSQGCGGGGTANCDYFTTYRASQFFVKGTEDLDVDVTTMVSATLAGLIPNSGFRISLDSALEADTHSYFVKRFASRDAYNVDLQPRLLVRFDDSIQDDTDNLYLDSPSYLFLYNYVRQAPANLVSGSTPVTGSQSLLLQLTTPVSGGTWSMYFTGSQHYYGHNPAVGIYSASVLISSTDHLLLPQWQTSGSITFTPIWGSLNGAVTYLTGSTIKAYPPQRGPQSLSPGKFNVTVHNLVDTLDVSEAPVLRVNLFDYTQPALMTAIRLPVELPGIVLRDAHYQVRDVDTAGIAIPFDTVTNSTRLSNDSAGMFFRLDASNLTAGHTYVIDILIITDGSQQLYRAVSAPFKVVALQ